MKLWKRLSKMTRKLVILDGHRFAGACDAPRHGEISPCTNGRWIDMGKVRRPISKRIRDAEREAYAARKKAYNAIR